MFPKEDTSFVEEMMPLLLVDGDVSQPALPFFSTSEIKRCRVCYPTENQHSKKNYVYTGCLEDVVTQGGNMVCWSGMNELW